MLKTLFAIPARLALVLTLFSCAAPKAIVVAPPPAPEKPQQAVVEPVVSEPAIPSKKPDDGIRLPDMLAMPEEGEFRATNPSAPKPDGGSGAVIARPPTEPPSRPKPKPGE
jgi:hypothetical protein